jgi:hypothetical protein
MVPDHTFLLDEGEAFVALDDQVLSMKEIVAMRVRVHHYQYTNRTRRLTLYINCSHLRTLQVICVG